MARVELTQNKGPEVIESISTSTSLTNPYYSTTVNVRLYTLHSYQVHNATGNTITFKILGSNFTDINGDPSTNYTNHWTTISSHSVANNNSLAYSDVWNFKFSAVLITGTTSSGLLVLEKHNA